MREILYKIYQSLSDEQKKTLTVWDLFLLSTHLSNLDKWILTLRVDIDIIYSLVDGQSPMTIARRLGIRTLSVYKIARLWGIVPVDISTTFSILAIYEDSMSFSEFRLAYDSYTNKKLFKEQALIIFYNIKRYLDFLDVLKEFDDENI